MRNFIKTTSFILILGILFSVVPSPTIAATTLVQTASGNGGGYVNSYTLALGSNATAGNTLILTITSGTTDTVTISDSQGNTWTKFTNVSDDRKTEGWIAYNIAAGATTITVQFEPSKFADSATIVREYSGLISASSPTDQFASANDGGSFIQTHTSGTTGTTAQNNELIIGMSGCSNATPTYSAGSGYANVASQAGFDSFTSAAIEDRSVTSTGTYSASFNTTGFVNCGTIVGTFKEFVAVPNVDFFIFE